MAEKPKTIFYSLSQALRGDKKDIPSELAKGNSEILSNNPGNEVSNLQNQQQRFADIQTLKTAQDIYTRSMYYDSDRISAYNDYRAMDQSPEIAVALDIMSDECVSRSDRGEIVTVYSEDSRIKREIQKLLTKLNVNYNLKFWIRTLLKYGDNFLKLEIDQHMGVYNITQLPVGEIHKEVGYDGNPYSVRYKWDINNLYFEDFQVAHFSLIADAEKIPYGRSILDPVRKLWKQLQLAEDALLVYRLVRAPERRMFFIDVGNTDTPDVEQYIEKIKAKLKKSQVVDQRTGNINMKFNLITFEEDFFIPVRGDKSGTRVETLPGACLALDTKIPLLDGRTLTLQEIINEWDSGKDNLWVYSCNPDTGESHAAPITWAGITKRNTKVMKLTLDNGKEIICTPDHKFVHRTNKFVRADNLKEGDSLMPFYKQNKPISKNKKEYEQIWDNHLQKWIFTHRMIGSKIKIKDFTFKIEENKNTIHHKDFNRFNNVPNNLLLMGNKDHYLYHSSLNSSEFMRNVVKKQWENNEFRKKVLNSLLEGIENRDNSYLSIPNRISEIKIKLLSDKISLNNKTDKWKEYAKKGGSKVGKTNILLYNVWKNLNKKNIITNSYNDWKKNLTKDEIKNFNSYDFFEFNLSTLQSLILNNNNIKLKNLPFDRHIILKLLKKNNFKTFKEYKNNILTNYNHKIIKIEYLEETIDTGTITVDGNETYHNFHTFALDSGVYNKNSNLGDIADVEYLQNKLFTGIKVPKTYLNYGEALPGGSTLSQADLRFARTINGFQEAVVMELRNIVNIHLKILGFDDDINNFTLTLTNPSTQQELLKLETMKARLDVFKDIFSSEATAPVSYSWAMEYILGFSKSEITQILIQKKIERKMFYEIERAHEEYMDTGIFTKIDKKFRKPDFDPDTQIDTDGEGGGDDSGGGGGFGGFGGGDSFGLGDTDMPDLDADNTDVGGGEDVADTSVDAADTEPEDTNLQENLLLENNKNFDTKTKNLLKGIDSFLHKIKNIDKN